MRSKQTWKRLAPEGYLSISDYAKHVGTDRNRVEVWLQGAKIPSIKICGRTFIHQDTPAPKASSYHKGFSGRTLVFAK